MKQRIRLSESQFNGLVKNIVKRVLRESKKEDGFSAEDSLRKANWLDEHKKWIEQSVEYIWNERYVSKMNCGLYKDEQDKQKLLSWAREGVAEVLSRETNMGGVERDAEYAIATGKDDKRRESVENFAKRIDIIKFCIRLGARYGLSPEDIGVPEDFESRMR